ncbi:MAG: hypothetical protein ICV87_02785 [Gemmatimonadetes bacterium]|nr:hypothetical protein [Gemmatimonadota bacterium]
MKTLFALLLCILAVSPAAAQRRDTSWTAAPVPDTAAAPARRLPAPQRIFNRTMNGVLGLALLGSVGGFTGYQLTKGEGGEDPGLSGLLLGGVIGGVTGGALGAALPEHGARCPYRTRAARGLLGAFAATGIYIAAGAGGAGRVVVTFPVGIPLGAAVMADC